MQNDEPSWLTEARRRYFTKKTPPVTDTYVGRGVGTSTIIEQMVLRSTNKPDVLIAGVGAEDKPIYCPLSPYFAAAQMESSRRDYNIDLLDIDSRVLDDVKNREKIFMTIKSEYNSMVDDWKILQVWRKYLRDTNQKEEIIKFNDTKNPAELFNSFQKIMNLQELKVVNNGGVDLALLTGIYFANIPESFRKKRNNNEINFINSDLAKVSFSTEKKYDFISCENLLYHIDMYGQMLSIYNMANALKKGGIILADDRVNQPVNGDSIVSPIFGGWLNPAKQRDLGVRFMALPYKGAFLLMRN